jgi:hypothetical protein
LFSSLNIHEDQEQAYAGHAQQDSVGVGRVNGRGSGISEKHPLLLSDDSQNPFTQRIFFL